MRRIRTRLRAWIATAVAAHGPSLLLEDGTSYLLLEDGTSTLLLEP